jgi:hypothetical protein
LGAAHFPTGCSGDGKHEGWGVGGALHAKRPRARDQCVNVHTIGALQPRSEAERLPHRKHSHERVLQTPTPTRRNASGTRHVHPSKGSRGARASSPRPQRCSRLTSCGTKLATRMKLGPRTAPSTSTRPSTLAFTFRSARADSSVVLPELAARDKRQAQRPPLGAVDAGPRYAEQPHMVVPGTPSTPSTQTTTHALAQQLTQRGP